MAIREIRVFGDPVLRAVCDPIQHIDEGIRALVNDLCDTVALEGRAGVAANQIGHTQRAFSLHIDGKISYILNPEIIELAGEPAPVGEGCLSVPGLWFEVMRYPKAVVRGMNLAGEEIVIVGEGLLAQALQHECDHLDGKLYLHCLDRAQRGEAMQQIRASNWF